MLDGCASGGYSPLGASFQDLFASDGVDAERAAALPYASLKLNTEDRRGLLVLGAQAGTTTLWPSGDGGLLLLHQGGLQATSGLGEDLLDTRVLTAGTVEKDTSAGETPLLPWQEATPGEFRMERSWRRDDRRVERSSARGRLTCGEAIRVKLPLVTRSLERCEQHLSWANGQITEGVLWRDPETRRLWKVEEQAWPEGPVIGWEVARPWW